MANDTNGVWIAGSNYNAFYENNVTLNSGYGIKLESSYHNRIYHNNFISNVTHAVTNNIGTNTWDDGYPSGGNYWSNYTDVDTHSGPGQNLTGRDEIWDHPYVIDANNQDNYPIVPEFSAYLMIPSFMIATLVAVAVFRRTSMKARARQST